MTRVAGVRNRLGKRKVCLDLDDVPPLPQSTACMLELYLFIKHHMASSRDIQLGIKIKQPVMMFIFY